MATPAALAAQAMHDMQPHPPAAMHPATPAHGSALPKVPQASPSVHHLSRQVSRGTPRGSHIPAHVPRHGQGSPAEAESPSRPGGHSAAPVSGPTPSTGPIKAEVPQAEMQHGTCETPRDTTSGKPCTPAGLTGAGHSCGAMHVLPGDLTQINAPQAAPPTLISQLDLTDLFNAAEQQAAARLAASHAYEQTRQRSHEASIARAGTTHSWPESQR